MLSLIIGFTLFQPLQDKFQLKKTSRNPQIILKNKEPEIINSLDPKDVTNLQEPSSGLMQILKDLQRLRWITPSGHKLWWTGTLGRLPNLPQFCKRCSIFPFYFIHHNNRLVKETGARTFGLCNLYFSKYLTLYKYFPWRNTWSSLHLIWLFITIIAAWLELVLTKKLNSFYRLTKSPRLNVIVLNWDKGGLERVIRTNIMAIYVQVHVSSSKHQNILYVE